VGVVVAGTLLVAWNTEDFAVQEAATVGLFFLVLAVFELFTAFAYVI
jgi:hypothetical protein